jgi:hypothetical protein
MNQAAKRSKGKPAPTIKFSFAVDRFGIRKGAQPLSIEYARNAVQSLTYWSEAIEKLFGDMSVAMEAATNARILPQHPSWAATSDALGAVRSWLGSQYPQSVISDSQADRDESSLDTTIGQIVDPKTQDAVEELRLYLQALDAWAPIFKAGVWVASLAATGSIEENPHAQMLQGLESIAAVYEFDITLRPEEILEEFRRLLPDSTSPGSVDGTRTPPVLKSALASGRKAMQSPTSEKLFVEGPHQLHNWLEDFCRLAEKTYPNGSRAAIRDAWSAIEDTYWRQWTWPPIGAVTRSSNSPAVSALDLIYTTRYGAVPFLHWRGGNLSVCQWSRIMALASQHPRPCFVEASRTGLANLGFEEESTRSQSDGQSAAKDRSTGRAILPIALISPISEFSTAWAWRPDAQVRTFALMPRARAEGDRAASQYGEDPAAVRHDGDTNDQTGVVFRTIYREDRWTALLDFVESADGAKPEASDMARRMRSGAWRRVYFGFDGKGDFARYVPNPRSIGEMVQAVREQYPDWFPPDPDKKLPPWRRVWEDVRLTGLIFRREVARVVRWSRLVRRKLARP